jgi:hypothetical protein
VWSKGPTMEIVERLREELSGLLDAIHCPVTLSSRR